MDLTGMSDKKKRKKLHGMMVKGDTFYIITQSFTKEHCMVWRCRIVNDLAEWGRPERYVEGPCKWHESTGMAVSHYKHSAASVSLMAHIGHDAREITALALELNRKEFGRDWNWPRN